MPCSPGEVQYFSDYELNLASRLLPSNSSADKARGCLIHRVLDPMGLQVTDTELPES